MWWRELFFTGLYTGYFPYAPGTAGSLLALLLYILEYLILGDISWAANLIIVLIMLYPSIRLGDAGEDFFGRKDPSEVVLDEIMGYWISILFYPFSWRIALLAFFIFRFVDIIKPYPSYKLQRYKGGFGILMDDVIAGIYTNITILTIIIISRFFGMKIY